MKQINTNIILEFKKKKRGISLVVLMLTIFVLLTIMGSLTMGLKLSREVEIRKEGEALLGWYQKEVENYYLRTDNIPVKGNNVNINNPEIQGAIRYLRDEMKFTGYIAGAMSDNNLIFRKIDVSKLPKMPAAIERISKKVKLETATDLLENYIYVETSTNQVFSTLNTKINNQVNEKMKGVVMIERYQTR